MTEALGKQQLIIRSTTVCHFRSVLSVSHHKNGEEMAILEKAASLFNLLTNHQ